MLHHNKGVAAAGSLSGPELLDVFSVEHVIYILGLDGHLFFRSCRYSGGTKKKNLISLHRLQVPVAH